MMQRVFMTLCTSTLAVLLCLTGADNAAAEGKWMTDIRQHLEMPGKQISTSGGWQLESEDQHGGGEQPRQPDQAEQETLGPGAWELSFGLDNQLFPSVIIALSTLEPDMLEPQEDGSFGSPLAMASVFVRGMKANDEVTVEISSTQLVNPSRMTVVLPDPDRVYEISPHLKYQYEKMLSVRQPYPEDITAKVYMNGKPLGEKTQTVVVRSVNDCFFGVYDEDGSNYQDWSEMFAAYVNESHPVIDSILGDALKKGYVQTFDGYQSSAQEVLDQVAAVWQTLKEKGLKYSNITTTSVESDTVMAQHVRMVGESTRGSQANCADGSVLFASIFRKLGLDSYIILVPGHMMVGVSLEPNGEEMVYIETTMLATSSLEEAVNSARHTLDSLVSSSANEEPPITTIRINEARNAGILPLRDVHL